MYNLLLHTVTCHLKAITEKPEQTFIAGQRLGKQVPAEMNTHATIEELPLLCNSEINAPL
jgi:hypothetical protein